MTIKTMSKKELTIKTKSSPKDKTEMHLIAGFQIMMTLISKAKHLEKNKSQLILKYSL